MGVFQSFRDDGWNTYYSEQHRAVWGDFSLVIFTYLCAVLGVIFIVIVIGSRGKERWTLVLRLVLCFHTGAVIIVCIIGRYWQVSHASVTSDYSINGPSSIEADIGVRVGLDKVNITLHSNASMISKKIRIDYNEELSLDHAGEAHKDYMKSLTQGLPWPILYVMDYFQVDTGGLRWGRKIGEAGHFTSIILWSALATWLMSNALLCIVVIRGLVFLCITGILMIIACIVYHCLQPSSSLVIHFDGGVIRLAYGWSYWLCLSTGIITVLIALLFLVLHWKWPAVVYPVYKVKKKLYKNESTDPAITSQVVEPLQLNTPITRERKHHQSLGRANPAFNLEELSDEDPFTKHFIKNKNSTNHQIRETGGSYSSNDMMKSNETSFTVVAEINEDSTKSETEFRIDENNSSKEFVGNGIKFLTPKITENNKKKSPDNCEIKSLEAANHKYEEKEGEDVIGAFKFKPSSQVLEEIQTSNLERDKEYSGERGVLRNARDKHSSLIPESCKYKNMNGFNTFETINESQLITSENDNLQENDSKSDSISITMDDIVEVAIANRNSTSSIKHNPNTALHQSTTSFQTISDHREAGPMTIHHTVDKKLNEPPSLGSNESASIVINRL